MNQHHDRDRKIFEVFVRENEGSLMAYIRTFTRDAQIAEDLFQETMLIAWRKFEEFDSRQAVTPGRNNKFRIRGARSESLSLDLSQSD